MAVEILSDRMQIGSVIYEKGFYTEVSPYAYIYFPNYCNNEEKWNYLIKKFSIFNKTWKDNIDLTLTWNEMILRYL